MTTLTIENDADERALFTRLGGTEKPYRVTIQKGRDRSLRQNALAFLLYKEIAEQRGDMTPEEVRAEAKLVCGIPLLRAYIPEFRETYDRCLKPLPYEDKIAFILHTDLGVTRLMTTAQMAEFLDEVYRRYSEQGLQLTQPAH